eukprot:2554904-Pleurochrysis_carterae.AAC.1
MCVHAAAVARDTPTHQVHLGLATFLDLRSGLYRISKHFKFALESAISVREVRSPPTNNARTTCSRPLNPLPAAMPPLPCVHLPDGGLLVCMLFEASCVHALRSLLRSCS